MAKLILVILGVVLILASIGILVPSFLTQTVVLGIDDTSDLRCSEFVTTAINSQFIEGTWIAIDIDDDGELEVFDYDDTDLDPDCGQGSRDDIISVTDDGYDVYSRTTSIAFICLPGGLGQTFKIEYRNSRTIDDIPCIRCDAGELKCLGFEPLICADNVFDEIPREIGLCGVECIEDFDCGLYECQDYVCSTEPIMDAAVLRQLFDRQSEEINNLQLTLSEKTALIQSLQANLDTKIQTINSLNLNIVEQGQVINILNLDVTDKAQLIDNLELDLAGKQELINNLQLSIDEKTRLIGELGNEVSLKIRMIEDLEKSRNLVMYVSSGILGFFGLILLILGIINRKKN